MATSSTDKPTPPPSAPVAAGDAEQSAQVIDVVTKETDKVADSAEPGKNEPTDAKKPNKAVLSNYLRVFTFGTKLDFFLMFLSSVSSIGAGIALPLMNIVFGQLVGAFTGYFLPTPTYTKSQFMHEINKLSLFLVYLFIGKFVLSYISMLAIRISGLRISAALRLAYLRATFAQPVSVIDTVSPGKVSTRITTSSNAIQLAISQHFAMMFQSVAFTVGLYVVSFIKSWLLTLVASAALPFIIIVYSILAPPFLKIQAVTGKHHEEASAMAYEIFSSIRIIAAFGAEKKLGDRHAEILEKAATNERKTGPLFGLLVAPSMIAQYGMFGLTFWFGIKQYTEGHIDDIGDIIVVLFSVMTAVLSIGRLASPFIAVAKAATAATEILATIDAPVPDTSGLKDPDISADADITFEDVKFSYPSRPDVQILHGLNATFPAGKVTAIVGPSGSGKSTVVGIVQRWYDLLGTTANPPPAYKPEDIASIDPPAEEKPKSGFFKRSKKDGKPKPTGDEEKPKKKEDEEKDLGPNTCTGAIKIGNTDLRSVDLKWWRSQIGLVQQEPFLFNDTIYNNVSFGLCGTQWEDLSKEEKLEMVKDACREAHAEEFISKLPESYDTLVGESGIKLSGGQRQRIAIARSIIKKPPILILDEATSAIDVRTERIVQAALDRVSKNRTTIVIAHRLSTIKRADKIMVLRQGKLVEEGTHDELLQIEAGVYFGLVHAQELAMEVDQDDTEDCLEKFKTAETEKSVTHERTDPTADKDPEYKERGLFRNFCKVVSEQRKHWLLFLIALISIIVAGAVYPLQAWIFAKVVTVFTYFFGDDLVREGNFWSGMFGVEAAGVGLAYFALGWASHLISVAVTRYYRQEYLENILKKRIPFFDTEAHSPGSLTSSISTDTEQLQQIMSTEMSLALIGVFNLLGSIIISFIFGWKLSLVSLFAALPPILVAGYLRFRLEIQFEKMNAKVFENSSQFATEAVGAFRTVTSLTMETMIGDRYHGLLKSHVSQAFGSAKFGTLVFAASDSVDMACMALSFWYGGTLLASHEYDPMEFFVIYMAIVQGAVAAGTWFAFAPNLAQAAAAANRILGSRSTSSGPSKPLETPRDVPGGVSIDFQHVYFTYQSREVPVLSNLNLKVEPGQFAALVGASGCGKSTTISLLERFYDIDSGHLLYNDQDVRTLDVAEYRKRISLVSQEPTLYEGTIRDNITLSVEEEGTVTDADIEQACQDAQIHEFISSLPDGYATQLGPKGLSLSGGQKQRLALARALLRNPKLLLLDEATSSLDSESEKLVQAAIERAADGRTVIAVAHRLATIQKADIIYVLGSGKVLEQGDHNTLLKKRGVYWQMCKAQALDR